MFHKEKKSFETKKFHKEKFHTEAPILRAKKSLGQNFLKSEPALNKMGEAGEVGDTDTILEIGPGKGALTTKLLLKAHKVIAIEKDRELFEFLKEKYSVEIDSGSLMLINGDILEIEVKDFGLKSGQYKIIANIPYNITGAIFKKFLSSPDQPKTMILLVQKEVAERIVARDGKESILSLSVKAYGTPKYTMKVAKRFFSPSPKVDSAIISITGISKSNFRNEIEEKNFFDVIKSGFAHKRKVLRKNLESLDISPSQIESIFKNLNIDSKSRAEDIKFEKWLEISRNIFINI
ncbi:MAG: 16S rRNA (adenine(1518)-N(6)/adenine(1519)-N(6))-dimethyltransferase RsmA [Candidatus Nomurabacteria bacterium]|nr:16S rRNA (adenine(1518)-N(6)/adenine(1519)-N(6))-dimethyltransferase RsmA [Candidatus Nomurabacteria bacterium]